MQLSPELSDSIPSAFLPGKANIRIKRGVVWRVMSTSKAQIVRWPALAVWFYGSSTVHLVGVMPMQAEQQTDNQTSVLCHKAREGTLRPSREGLPDMKLDSPGARFPCFMPPSPEPYSQTHSSTGPRKSQRQVGIKGVIYWLSPCTAGSCRVVSAAVAPFCALQVEGVAGPTVSTPGTYHNSCKPQHTACSSQPQHQNCLVEALHLATSTPLTAAVVVHEQPSTTAWRSVCGESASVATLLLLQHPRMWWSSRCAGVFVQDVIVG